MINSSPCFDVCELQSKDKGVYISLKNNLNRGELNNAIYFCSLVNKKGRTFSFMTHTRILILLNWKNKPYSIGYIQSMRTLPPWAHLPERKFQKELKIIKTMLVKEKCLEIRFHDEAQSWDLEFQTKAMAKTWIHLIQTHIAIQQNKQSMQKNKKKQQNNSSNALQEQSQVYQLMIQEENLSPRSVISKSTDQRSPEALNDLSLLAKLTSEKEQWLLKQKQLNMEMQLLKQQNAEIKAQNQRFKAINREIKEESARVRIAKSVLTIIKEEYQKKHLQLTQLLTRKSFQIQKLLEKCADVIVLKNSLQQQLYHIKKKQNRFKQTGNQAYVDYDFQFSSSSNENTKQIAQSQPNLNSRHQIQRHNTQNILIINQNITRFANQGQLVRQNTIC